MSSSPSPPTLPSKETVAMLPEAAASCPCSQSVEGRSSIEYPDLSERLWFL